MSERTCRSVLNQKEVHQLAMIRNQWRPTTAPRLGVHLEGHDKLIVIGADLCFNRQRLVERVVSVIAIFGVPPFFPAISEKRQCSRRPTHGEATAPSVA